MDKEENQSTEKILNNFEPSQNSPFFSTKLLVFLIIVVAFGIGSGYFLAKNGVGLNLGPVNIGKNAGSSIPRGTIVGSNDTKTFKDTTEGILQEGGIEGEGQFHLVRPGGESQNVYLTSSIVDLSKFKERKIKVWGETQKAKRAGWLMDVGRVEVLE